VTRIVVDVARYRPALWIYTDRLHKVPASLRKADEKTGSIIASVCGFRECMALEKPRSCQYEAVYGAMNSKNAVKKA